MTPESNRSLPVTDERTAVDAAETADGLDARKAIVDGQYPSFDRLRDARARIAEERALAAVRGTGAGAPRTRGPQRARRPLVAAGVVAALSLGGGAWLASSTGPTAEVTATTPVDSLSWRPYRSVSSSFRADLPGAPVVTSVGVGSPWAMERFVVSLPDLDLRIDVTDAGTISPGDARATAERRASETGLVLSEVVSARSPWGDVVDATMADPAPVGLVRVIVTSTHRYTISVQSGYLSARTSAIHERLVASFSPVGVD